MATDTASISPSKEHVECKELNLDVEFGGIEARNKLERRLLWKLDLRMSMLVLIYILNFIDRNNASAARSRGLVTDLHLEGKQFATLLSILYVGYIIMQIPSNMFLNYIGKPSLYLPACTVIWGIISALTGITTNVTGVLLTRFFLGFVEAAFFPGAVFLISKWYKRDEIGLRLTILSCGNIISNAFGAFIASGILSDMNDNLGHAAWRWPQQHFHSKFVNVESSVCCAFPRRIFPRWAVMKWKHSQLGMYMTAPIPLCSSRSKTGLVRHLVVVPHAQDAARI